MKSSRVSNKALRFAHRTLLSRPSSFRLIFGSTARTRCYHDDGRQRLSNFWAPTGGIAPAAGTQEDSHSLLVRAGFVRQAHAGLFQFLPLGLRVQEKVEKLLDKHMNRIGASKILLSTFSTESLWEKTGRLDKSSNELFRFEDRKGGKYLLSPTHEEEITALVGSIVNSYKELPLRVYQISRKYRDEPRPRQGLLRTREFLMKDLYTFDADREDALRTYDRVRRIYAAFFDEFKLPYLTAEASSGDIGGDLSHEYHFPSSKGEDNIISCNSCDYVANEELAKSGSSEMVAQTSNVAVLETDHDDIYSTKDGNDFKTRDWFGVSEDRKTLIQAILPRRMSIGISTGDGQSSRLTQINPHALRRVCPRLDMSVDDGLYSFRQYGPTEGRNLIQIYDYRIPLKERTAHSLRSTKSVIKGVELSSLVVEVGSIEAQPDFVRIEAGDRCPQCETGTLKVQNAVELGHTFHLGTRYSKPLAATVVTDSAQQHPENDAPGQTPMQMGCHGIGVSRLIAAVADSLADSKGLNWPSVIAPFQAIVVPTKGQEDAATEAYDLLSDSEKGAIDTILDDRKKDFGWKLRDADMIGYPVIVVAGRDWKKERKCEVQCRRLGGLKESVPASDLRGFVEGLLKQL